MKLTLSLGCFLLVLWLLLSGHFDPLLISMGVASVILTLFISHKMKVIDRESHPIHISFSIIKFWLILAGKIFKSNLDVAQRILGFKPVNPQLIRLKLDRGSDLSKAMYANAITLTPGSASLHIEDGYLYVHTISEEGAKELLAGEMAEIIPQEQTERSASEGEAK